MPLADIYAYCYKVRGLLKYGFKGFLAKFWSRVEWMEWMEWMEWSGVDTP